MARPAHFSEDDVLDAAALGVHKYGRSVTLAQIAAELGGPTGSIYHRFPSREHLMVRLWLRSIGRFHAGLLAAYALPDPQEALLQATLHVPQYCRDHPVDAFAMTLYRQPVLATAAPEPLRQPVVGINDEVDAALRALVSARFGHDSDEGDRLLMVATRMSPYGLVRPFVGQDVPEWLDEVCVAAARGILELGDSSVG